MAQLTKQPILHWELAQARGRLSIFHATLLGKLGLRWCYALIYTTIIPHIEAEINDFSYAALPVAQVPDGRDGGGKWDYHAPPVFDTNEGWDSAYSVI